MFKQKTLIVSIGLALLLVLGSAVGVLSKSESDQIDVFDVTGLTLSEIEALYPMSAEAEAALVQVVPQVPVIIDGVYYEPEDITLFNGQRLRFVVDTDGVLHAFTTVKGLEQFVAEEFGQPEPRDAGKGETRGGGGWFALYEHILYGGAERVLWSEGQADYTLGYMNNRSSSLYVSVGVLAGMIFEYEDLGGSYLYISENTGHPWLTYFGWNDRASSAARAG